jgi:hypothetical protein
LIEIVNNKKKYGYGNLVKIHVFGYSQITNTISMKRTTFASAVHVMFPTNLKVSVGNSVMDVPQRGYFCVM